jgi:hypothetical protein
MSSFEKINPSLVDVTLDHDSGYSPEVAAGDTRDVLWNVCGSASREFPRSMWIEPRDWADKARDNDKYNTWPMNYRDRFTNQDPTHECSTHSLDTNISIARNRGLGIIFPDGPKKNHRYDESNMFGSVWLSPLSVYCEANPRQWGGSGIRQVLEIAVRRGMLPDRIQPRDYGFEHTLQGTTGKGNSNQSSGRWVRVSDFPDGWQETASLFKPQEIVFPESWEQAVCLVLNGCAVSVGRRGHAIPWCKWNVNEQAMAYPDSYDITRYDSLSTVRSAWQGSFSIISTTLPNDRLNPAKG